MRSFRRLKQLQNVLQPAASLPDGSLTTVHEFQPSSTVLLTVVLIAGWPSPQQRPKLTKTRPKIRMRQRARTQSDRRANVERGPHACPCALLWRLCTLTAHLCTLHYRKSTCATGKDLRLAVHGRPCCRTAVPARNRSAYSTPPHSRRRSAT